MSAGAELPRMQRMYVIDSMGGYDPAAAKKQEQIRKKQAQQVVKLLPTGDELTGKWEYKTSEEGIGDPELRAVRYRTASQFMKAFTSGKVGVACTQARKLEDLAKEYDAQVLELAAKMRNGTYVPTAEDDGLDDVDLDEPEDVPVQTKQKQKSTETPVKRSATQTRKESTVTAKKAPKEAPSAAQASEADRGEAVPGAIAVAPTRVIGSRRASTVKAPPPRKPPVPPQADVPKKSDDGPDESAEAGDPADGDRASEGDAQPAEAEATKPKIAPRSKSFYPARLISFGLGSKDEAKKPARAEAQNPRADEKVLPPTAPRKERGFLRRFGRRKAKTEPW